MWSVIAGFSSNPSYLGSGLDANLVLYFEANNKSQKDMSNRYFCCTYFTVFCCFVCGDNFNLTTFPLMEQKRELSGFQKILVPVSETPEKSPTPEKVTGFVARPC